jgi:tRNA pseudouridine(38-40) synthase
MADSAAKECVCSICHEVFSSKSKLFKHLEIHGYENPNVFAKVVLAIGWINDCCTTDSEEWVVDTLDETDSYNVMNLVGKRTIYDAMTTKIDRLLTAAILRIEGGLNQEASEESIQKGLKGYARGSYSSQKFSHIYGYEGNEHGLCDMVSYLSLKSRYLDDENEWLRKVNALLPQNIRIHKRFVILSEVAGHDYHSERHCTQQLYDIVIPLHTLVPSEAQLPADFETSNKPFYHKHEDNEASRESLQMMLEYFPTDSLEGRKRIYFFRKIKKICKLFQGSRHIHNFVTGGACSSQRIFRRKVNRISHKTMVKHKGVDYAVFSATGDLFLRGQLRHMFGLVFCVMLGYIPLELVQSLISKDFIADSSVPSIPGWCIYISGTKNANWDTTADCSVAFDRTLLLGFREQIMERIAEQWTETDPAGGYLTQLKSQCAALCRKAETLQSLRRLNTELMLQGTYNASMIVPTMYQRVLSLLQHADKVSGLWPSTTIGRREVIEDSTLTENGGEGGSFSIGYYPPHLPQPKGNKLFPDLLEACMVLERNICPHRKPSSTIAVNRHAQFLPHRDTGVGSGQSQSMIVGLGDYVGGEIVVEGTPHNILYQPIEFDGWKQIHYTFPFKGSRYSLVYFTPQGTVF